MSEIQAELTKHPVKTRVKLTGPMIVARDIAHAKLLERLETTGTLPDYIKTTLSITLAQRKHQMAWPQVLWPDNSRTDGFLC